MRLCFVAVVLGVISAPAFAFEPGSLGDAYRDFGYVQGCTDGGELPGCTIIAGGSQFVAPEGGQTPAEVMAALRAMPPLTYVEFRGDILTMNDSFAEIAVGAVAAADAGADPYGDMIRGMQGTWVSVDDPQSVVRVEGLMWTDVYGGEVVSQSVMSFADACSDGSEGGGAVMELFSIPPQDMPAMCYSDLYADKSRMEMSYMGRGNTLAFARAE
jgi:hypothetical protein